MRINIAVHEARGTRTQDGEQTTIAAETERVLHDLSKGVVYSGRAENCTETIEEPEKWCVVSPGPRAQSLQQRTEHKEVYQQLLAPKDAEK